MLVYKLLGDKINAVENDKVTAEMPMADFVSDELDLVETLVLELKDRIYLGEGALDELEGIVNEHLIEYFKKLFKDNKNELESRKVMSEISKLRSHFKALEKELQKELLAYSKIALHKLLKKDLKTGGSIMFKTLKEAKKFTSHLDALATEIQTLNDIDEQVKMHLAERLDKISNLIEEESSNNEKIANGVGSGSWAFDADEARYMSTFGGTGALKRDADEPYMDQYMHDDHKEVLQRKEPQLIRDDGAKVLQPSDNYNEAEVAQKLKTAVKEYLKTK